MFFDMLVARPKQEAAKIEVGRDMVAAFTSGIEWYKPVMGEVPLIEEGGHSESSYRNLCILIKTFGQPQRVERQANGNVLVSWTARDKYYLATGFDCGYMGAGPYYFALFGDMAGFGDVDDLYLKIADIARKFDGVIWSR
jgi:hypothetical protein